MSAALTNYRNAITDAVQTATGIPIKKGKFDGPASGGDIGCCYPVGSREDANVLRAIFEVRVRLFKNFQEANLAEPEAPLDPTPLEELAELVQTTLGDGDQSFGGSVWFGRVTEYEVNMEWYGVELAVVSVGWNPFRVVEPAA